MDTNIEKALAALEQSDRLNDAEKAFLREVLLASVKHGLSISHEDGHGGFIIEEGSDNLAWLASAFSYRKLLE